MIKLPTTVHPHPQKLSSADTQIIAPFGKKKKFSGLESSRVFDSKYVSLKNISKLNMIFDYAHEC